MDTARRFTSIESSFDPCNIYRDCPRGVPRGKQNMVKNAHSRTSTVENQSLATDIPLYLVEDRWVHDARRLTSIEFSFDPCNIYRDGPRGVGYPVDARSVGDSHPSCWFICSITDDVSLDEFLEELDIFHTSMYGSECCMLESKSFSG